MRRRSYGILAALAGIAAVAAYLFIPVLSSGTGTNARVIVVAFLSCAAMISLLRALL